jgi:pilus assembly protein Flp/PilA
MKTNLGMLYSRVQRLISEQEGQDLVEYALVVALVALGATTGMKALASDINTAFQNVGTSFTTIL